MDSWDFFIAACFGGFFGHYIARLLPYVKNCVLVLIFDTKRFGCSMGLHKWTTEKIDVMEQKISDGVPQRPQQKKGSIKRCSLCPAVNTKSIRIPEGLRAVESDDSK